MWGRLLRLTGVVSMVVKVVTVVADEGWSDGDQGHGKRSTNSTGINPTVLVTILPYSSHRNMSIYLNTQLSRLQGVSPCTDSLESPEPSPYSPWPSYWLDSSNLNRHKPPRMYHMRYIIHALT